MTEPAKTQPVPVSKAAGPGYANFGFQGFGKSGKTYTAACLAIAIRRHFKYEAPIAMYDTENGSSHLRPLFAALDVPFEPTVSRSFSGLLSWSRNLVANKRHVAFIDSITHPWDELKSSWLDQINAERKDRDQRPLTKLGFTAWQKVKPVWKQWSEAWMINAPVHLIVAGRAKLDFAEITDSDGEEKLSVTGVSMRTEGQFTFETDVLVELSQRQDRSGPRPRLIREAVVLGDRSSVLDGEFGTFVTKKTGGVPDHAAHLEAVWDFFRPHIELLKPHTRTVVDMKASEHDVQSGDPSWQREKDKREITLERILAACTNLFPSTGGADRKAKGALLRNHFMETSWKAIEKLPIERLEEGLVTLTREAYGDGTESETDTDTTADGSSKEAGTG